MGWIWKFNPCFAITLVIRAPPGTRKTGAQKWNCLLGVRVETPSRIWRVWNVAIRDRHRIGTVLPSGIRADPGLPLGVFLGVYLYPWSLNHRKHCCCCCWRHSMMGTPLTLIPMCGFSWGWSIFTVTLTQSRINLGRESQWELSRLGRPGQACKDFLN